MSFSRYSIEKKQVSTDRGVHWEDVTPGETRKGNLVGIARTLLECEDMACDLQKTEYTVIAGFLPDEICGDIFKTLPSGIAMNVTWTAGAICCNTWQSASPNTIDRYGRIKEHAIGLPYCIKDGVSTTVCPSFTYSSTTVDGRELTNLCFQVTPSSGWECPDELCACFRITSFMPWAEGKETWSLIQAQDYKREHCSDAWELDGDPYIAGIAERWIYVDENFNDERWLHQTAEKINDEGVVTEWKSDSTYVYRHMTDNEPESNIDILDYVINDGVICWAGTSPFSNNIDIEIARDTSFGLSGHIFTYKSYDASWTDGYYVSSNPDQINGTHQHSTGWSDPPIPLSNNLTVFDSWGTDRTTWVGVFCNTTIGYESQHSQVRVITDIGSVLSGTRSGRIVNDYGETVAYPCRIHENLGQTDDYWNSSSIGYVFRNGDGSMVVMETLSLEDGQLVKQHPDWTR